MSLSVITHLDYRLSEEICCNNIYRISWKKRRRLGFFKYFTAATLPGVFKKTALFEKKAFDITYLCICLLQQFLKMLFTKDPRRFRSELNMAYFLFLKFNNLRYFKDFIDDFELVIYFDFLINVNF